MEAASISRSSFPPISRAEWLQAAHAEGPAAPLSPSYADLHLERIRMEGTGAALIPSTGANWNIVQRVDDPDAKRANHQAQADIAGGATGLAIIFEGAPNAFGYGLPARPEALAAALHGIEVGRIYLRLDVHPASRAAVDWMVELMRRKRVDPARLSLSFGIDPAAIFAGNGRLRMSIEALQASMPQSLAHFFAMGIPAVLLEADGRVVHNAGATEAQELGVMLSSAVSHLRMFQEARQPLIYALPHIGFAVSVDQDQVLSIAKLRALRRLWGRVQQACGVAPTHVKVHAETSYRMMTARAPETNVLRGSMAAFAAAAAGADTVCVLPHSLPHGLPEAKARRLARNGQLLLAHESHLGSLGNPFAGSEDLDMLTATLCEAAWEEFRLIEEEGGLLRSLARGQVQARVGQAAQARWRRLAEDAIKIVGSSVHVSEQEPKVSTLKAERRTPPQDGVVFCQELPPVRIDEMPPLPEADQDDGAASTN